MTKDINTIFQDYIIKNAEYRPINFDSLIKANPSIEAELNNKIAAYQKIVGVFRGEPAKTCEDPLIGKVINGCLIKATISRGGMSTVYLAHQEALGRDVAVKVLNPVITNSDRSLGRFRRESKNIAKLQHENILPVHDVGEKDGLHFVITDFVEGLSLDKIIEYSIEKGTQPLIKEVATLFNAFGVGEGATIADRFQNYPDFAVNVIKKTALALQYAHQKGIIHRDIKPSNIIVKPSGEPVLIDFGLSRDFHEMGMTQAGDYLGTPVYSAPEQLFGRQDEVDRQSDIYSLGITFYKLLTGHLPYKGHSLLDTVTNIKRGKQTRPSHYWPEISKYIERVILKSIQLDKKRRYQDIKEFIDNIDLIISNRPDISKIIRPLGMGQTMKVTGIVLVVIFVVLAFFVGKNFYFDSQVAIEKNLSQYIAYIKSLASHDLPLDGATALMMPDTDLIVYYRINQEKCINECQNSPHDFENRLAKYTVSGIQRIMRQLPDETNLVTYIEYADAVRYYTATFGMFKDQDLLHAIDDPQTDVIKDQAMRYIVKKDDPVFATMDEWRLGFTKSNDFAKAKRSAGRFTITEFTKYKGFAAPLYLPNILLAVVVDLPDSAKAMQEYLPLNLFIQNALCEQGLANNLNQMKYVFELHLMHDRLVSVSNNKSCPELAQNYKDKNYLVRSGSDYLLYINERFK